MFKKKFFFFILILLFSSNLFAEEHIVKIKIYNPNSTNNCVNKWCQVKVLIPARTYIEKGWLREDLSNLAFRDPNYSFADYSSHDNSIGNGYDICTPDKQKDDLSWWVDAVKNGNNNINRLPVWLLIYNLQPGETRYINMIINNDLPENEKLYANPRALVDFRSDSGWSPDGDCNDSEEDNRHSPASLGEWNWSVIGNSVFYFFAHGLWENFIGWQDSGDASWNGYGVPQYGNDDNGNGSFGNAGFCNLWIWHAHCVKNLKILSDIKYNPDKYKEVNTGENAFFSTPFTLSMKIYFKSSDVIKDWNSDYANYYENNQTNVPYLNIYFLTQLSGNSNYWGGGCNDDWHSQDDWRCSPNSEDIDVFPGYKLIIYKPSDWKYYSNDQYFHRYYLLLKLYKQNTKNGGWNELAEFDYPIKESDVVSKIGWFLYDATKHQFDIKVGDDKIFIYINGVKIGEVNRNDNWEKGAIGFDRKTWVTADWNDINEIIVRAFFQQEPITEVYGHVDLAVSEDGESYRGSDIIEFSPDVQSVFKTIDGSSLDKYVFSVYNIATEDQIKKFYLKIKNRGDEDDTYDLNFEINASPSENDWVFYWCDENGDNCSFNIPNVVNIQKNSSLIKVIKVIPSPSALFQGGSVDIKLTATSHSDLSEDTVEFNTRIYPLLGCYWKYKIPINISYTNPTQDSKYDVLKDYQVYVSISGIDFSSANDTGSDIIVTNERGAKIPFWIKKFDKENGSLKIWIKVPEIVSGMNNKIYIWFGNKNLLTSYSDIKNTFDLWEDWKDYSPDLLNIKNNNVGCPDGTEDCSNEVINTSQWKNLPICGQNFNWWFLYNKFLSISENGYSRDDLIIDKPVLVCDIYQLTPPPDDEYPYEEQWPCKAPYTKSNEIGWHSCEWGPILRGGKAVWDHYEVAYLTLIHDTNYVDGLPNPLFNPAFMIDTGDLFGMEIFRPISDYSQYVFRPVSTGIDWVWQKKTKLPFNLVKDHWYWVKVRVYKYEDNGELKAHVEVLMKDAGNNLNNAETTIDIDNDDDFSKIADFYVPSIFVLPRGSIGFSGWDGGWAIDTIRVRKFIANGPSCSKDSIETLTPRENISLSQPQITPPFFEGRSAYIMTRTKPFSWLGDVIALDADCYIGDNCSSDQDKEKEGTLSLFGKINDNNSKGLGYYLMKSLPGENNRTNIEDSNWINNGRFILTRFDNKSSHDFNGFDKFDMTNCEYLKERFGTTGTCNQNDNFTDETEKLIKFVRGFYISDYQKSIGRNMDSDPLYGNNNGVPEDNEQWKLGDILHSNPLIVGIPNMYYGEESYSHFVNQHRNRDLVVYFMSNEGMLHAFRIAKYENNNTEVNIPRYIPVTPLELWAFISESALAKLKNTTEADHHYIADGLLRAIDVKDGNTWKTILLGISGKESEYIYAIDITDPASPKFLWELNKYSNPDLFYDLGNAISAPAMGKINISGNDVWVAIFGSGFSNNFIRNYTNKKAYLAIVNILTGEVIKEIKVNDKIGNVLTNISTLRDKDGNILKIYFGDYYGALWRITNERLLELINQNTPVLSASDMLFKPYDYNTSTSPSEVKRPIVVSPVIAKGENEWWIYFGTGDYDEYNPNYPHQRFYGIKDSDTTYTDEENCDNTSATCGDFVNVTSSSQSNTNKESWVIELGHNDEMDVIYSSFSECYSDCLSGGSDADTCETTCRASSKSTKDNNERVLQPATVFGGKVFFTTYQPENNPCGGGKSRFYAVKYDTGTIEEKLFLPGTSESNEQNNSSNNSAVTLRSVELSTKGIPSKVLIYTGHGGKNRIVASGLINSSTGVFEKVNLNPSAFINSIDILLWRRIK